MAAFSATLNSTSIYFIITCGKSGRFFGHSKFHKSIGHNYLCPNDRRPPATFWPILDASSYPASFSDAGKNGRLRTATVRFVSARAHYILSSNPRPCIFGYGYVFSQDAPAGSISPVPRGLIRRQAGKRPRPGVDIPWGSQEITLFITLIRGHYLFPC